MNLYIRQTSPGLAREANHPLSTSLRQPPLTCYCIRVGLPTWIFKSIYNGYWNCSHWSTAILKELFVAHLEQGGTDFSCE